MSNDTIFDYIRNRNRIFDTDGYNPSHPFLKQNMDFEGTHYYNRTKEQFLYLWSHYVKETLFMPITLWDVDDFAKSMQAANILCPYELLERVPKEFNGYFPLRIQALPDGHYCPIGTPFSQLRNTAEGFGDLTTWYESCFMHAWYPSAVAFETYEIYKFMKDLKDEYALDESFMSNIHNFGFRSHSGIEESIIGGSAFNIFFSGSDNLNTYKFTEGMTTVSAQAHKVVGNFKQEIDSFIFAIKSVANQFYNFGKGKPVVALVIDTFMPYRVIQKYMEIFVPIAIQQGVHVIMRPDSGKVLNQFKEIIKKMVEQNYTNVSVIIGESRTKISIKSDILELISENLPFEKLAHGIGGGLHSHLNRDTHGWGAKTCVSNNDNSMKFSEDRIKQSIPGYVDIIAIDNELVIEMEEYVHGNGLYEDIYYHSSGQIKPTFKVYSFREARDLIHYQIDTNLVSQQKIIKSSNVIKEMDRIKKLHGMV